jgi:hypothetical protein
MLGQLMKDCVEKMRVDQLNNWDKKLQELMEKIPDEYLDMKATDFVKVCQQIQFFRDQPAPAFWRQ